MGRNLGQENFQVNELKIQAQVAGWTQASLIRHFANKVNIDIEFSFLCNNSLAQTNYYYFVGAFEERKSNKIAVNFLSLQKILQTVKKKNEFRFYLSFILLKFERITSCNLYINNKFLKNSNEIILISWTPFCKTTISLIHQFQNFIKKFNMGFISSILCHILNEIYWISEMVPQNFILHPHDLLLFALLRYLQLAVVATNSSSS